MERFVQFETVLPLPHFPRVYHAGFELRTTPAYHWEGRDRGGGEHCIYQHTLTGCGIFRDAAGEHPVPAGHGFLCESHDPQTAYYYPPDGREPWNFLYLTFVGSTAHILVRDLVQRHGPIYALPKEKGILKRLCGLRTNAPSVHTVTPGDGAALIMELLCALECSRSERQEESTDDRLVRRAKREIEETLTGRLAVATLAVRLCVTREHLSRVFKARTGMTPYQYILRRQMTLACQWLAEDGPTIKEIAGRLGFANPGNFIRVFQALLGDSPARFRATGALPHLL